MQREDVRMLEPGNDVDLVKKAVRPQGVGQLGVEYFDGDGAVVPDILGKVDRGHTAAAQFALERVAAEQGLRE
jgi:hypothetical protein